MKEVDVKRKILYYFNVVAFFFLFITSSTTIDLVLSKKLRLDYTKWFLIIGYLIITILLLFIGPWYRSIINAVIIFGYMYIFVKYVRKE